MQPRGTYRDAHSAPAFGRYTSHGRSAGGGHTLAIMLILLWAVFTSLSLAAFGFAGYSVASILLVLTLLLARTRVAVITVRRYIQPQYLWAWYVNDVIIGALTFGTVMVTQALAAH